MSGTKPGDAARQVEVDGDGARRLALLEAVARAADRWLMRSRHLQGCPFHPLGAACTCGLGELDSAITELEELDGKPLNPDDDAADRG